MFENGKFVSSATVRNGRVRVGDTVQHNGETVTIEAIWQEKDRRTGSVTFLCGPNGTKPVVAGHAEKIARA